MDHAIQKNTKDNISTLKVQIMVRNTMDSFNNKVHTIEIMETNQAGYKMECTRKIPNNLKMILETPKD